MDYFYSRLEPLLRRWRDEKRIGFRHFSSGPNNRISDVAGVTVGHSTLNNRDCQTGVTAILPTQNNLYQQPLPCGVAVINGFAKPIGLVQIEELGVIETPIVLTNTLCVGRGFSGAAQYMIEQNPEIGRALPTVNPVVLECNDGYLNDIQAMAVSEDLVVQTLKNTHAEFKRGSVGAGRGMSCFAMKGGIGTSSCYVPELDATLGVLVLANFGALPALLLEGIALGEEIERAMREPMSQEDKGSIIIIMATDAPLSARQLKRIAKRAGAGLGRLGSYWGHGSGDIALAFSTAPQSAEEQSTEEKSAELSDQQLDPLLHAAAEGTEQAVIDALLQATSVRGFGGHFRTSLSEVLDILCRKYL